MQGKHTMANRYMEIHSTSLIREIQIKTTVKYCLTPVSMVVIKKAGNNQKSFLQDVGKKRPLCTDGGNVNKYRHYGKHMEDPQRTKNRTTI